MFSAGGFNHLVWLPPLPSSACCSGGRPSCGESGRSPPEGPASVMVFTSDAAELVRCSGIRATRNLEKRWCDRSGCREGSTREAHTAQRLPDPPWVRLPLLFVPSPAPPTLGCRWTGPWPQRPQMPQGPIHALRTQGLQVRCCTAGQSRFLSATHPPREAHKG